MATIKRLALVAACLALAALCACGPSHKMYDQRMASHNVEERRAAAKELRAAPRNPKLVPAILQATRDEDADVRSYGFYALGRVDPREEGVVAAIFIGIEDQNREVRRAVVNALYDFNPFPTTCLPLMIRLLIDEDEKIRDMVVSQFENMERSTGVSSLVRNLGTAKSDEQRAAIAFVLGRMGPQAKNALPKLKEVAAGDGSPEFRAVIEQAIAAIEGGKAMPARMPVIKSEPKEKAKPDRATGSFGTAAKVDEILNSSGSAGGSGASGSSFESGGSSGSGGLGGFKDFGD